MDINTKGLDAIETDPNPQDHAIVEEEAEVAYLTPERRRLRITYKDLKDHGFTPSCPRCSLHSQNQHTTPPPPQHAAAPMALCP
jgi:hypothetical protein